MTNLRAPSAMWVAEDWPKLVHQTSLWRSSWWEVYKIELAPPANTASRRLAAEMRWSHIRSSSCRSLRFDVHEDSNSECFRTSSALILEKWKWKTLMRIITCHLFRINSASLATLTMWSFMAWERRRPWKKGIFQANQLLHCVKKEFKRYCRPEDISKKTERATTWNGLSIQKIYCWSV